MVVITMVVFIMLKDHLPFTLAAERSSETATSKFGNLKDNWPLLFSSILMILLESILEELLDRGFLMNWIERLFSSTTFATIMAVVLHAPILGLDNLIIFPQDL